MYFCVCFCFFGLKGNRCLCFCRPYVYAMHSEQLDTYGHKLGPHSTEVSRVYRNHIVQEISCLTLSLTTASVTHIFHLNIYSHVANVAVIANKLSARIQTHCKHCLHSLTIVCQFKLSSSKFEIWSLLMFHLEHYTNVASFYSLTVHWGRLIRWLVSWWMAWNRWNCTVVSISSWLETMVLHLEVLVWSF